MKQLVLSQFQILEALNDQELFSVEAQYTVKLGDKERFDKEQIGVKELLKIQKMPKLGITQLKIMKIGKKRGLQKNFGPILGFYTKKNP